MHVEKKSTINYVNYADERTIIRDIKSLNLHIHPKII